MGKRREVERNNLGGRVFVVTGAGNGIGRRVAMELLARGASVAGADINEQGLVHTAQLVVDPSRFSAHVVDVSDAAAVSAFSDVVASEYGRVDGVFNIAGIPQGFELIAEIDEQRIRTLMEVNFYGTVRMTRAFLPHLERNTDGGVVMNTSSLSALVPVPGAGIYGATKAAVEMFGYGLAQDLRASSSKVTVTTVVPGTIWTDLVRHSAQTLRMPDAVAKTFAMKPEKAARRMINGTLKGRVRVVIAKDGHFYNGMRRLSSRGAERLSYLQVAGFVYSDKRRGTQL